MNDGKMTSAFYGGINWNGGVVKSELSRKGWAQFTDSPTFQLWEKWLKWVSGLIFGDGEARHLGNCQSSMSLHWKALIRLVRCPSVGTLYYTRPIKAFSLAISRSKITEAADISINFIRWYFFRIRLNATKLQRYAACAFQGFLTSCFDLMWWCMCTDAGIFLSFTD